MKAKVKSVMNESRANAEAHHTMYIRRGHTTRTTARLSHPGLHFVYVLSAQIRAMIDII